MKNKKNKKGLYQKARASKTFITLFYCFLGVLLFSGYVIATTVISDQGVSSPEGTYTNITADNVTASNLYFGDEYGKFNETCPNRPFTTNEETTLTVGVGDDYETIQEAVCQVPYMLRHKFTINVDAGTYDEDVYIPAIVGSGLNTGGTEGSVIMFILNGDTMANTKLKSLQITSHTGTWVSYIRDFEIYGQEPTSDEGVSVSVYGSNSVLLQTLNMTNTSVNYPIMFYSSSGGIHTINFEGTKNGVSAKGVSQIYMGDYYNDAKLYGSVTNTLLNVGKGSVVHIQNNQVSIGDENVECSGGFVTEENNVTGTKSYCMNSVQKDSSFVSGTQSGLVLGMNFNTDSMYGNTSLDSSRNNINSAYLGSDAYFNSSGSEGWLEIYNDGDYLAIEENNITNLTETLTLMAWVNMKGLDTSNRNYIIWANDDAPALEVDNNGVLKFHHDDTGGNFLSESSAGFYDDYANIWTHIAGTFDKDGRIVLYINGQEETHSIANGYPIYRKGLGFRIGQDNTGVRAFNGSIDDVRLYNRALSPEEINSIANNRNIQIEPPKLKSTGGTIYGKITFALGEIIDNLIDGWLRITGSLEVTGDLNVTGAVTSANINEVYYVQANNGTDLEYILENNCANGCSVKVPNGVYQIDSAIALDDLGNISIELDNNAIINATIFNPFIFINFSNVEIRGGRWQGASGVNIKGLVFNCNTPDCGNVKIENTLWDKNIYRAIEFSAKDVTSKIEKISLIGNTFTTFDRAMEFNSETDIDNGTIKEIIISNNKFSRSGTSTISTSVITIAKGGSVGEVIISNNIFKDIVADRDIYGIEIRGGRSDINNTVNNIMISNNIFKNLTSLGEFSVSGVRVSPGNRLLFNSNICEDIGYLGVNNHESHCIWTFESPDTNEGSQVIISNNIIKNIFTGSSGGDKDDSEGIYCKSTSCIITGNSLTDGGDARSIAMKGNSEGAKNQIVSNNVIEYIDRTPYCGGIRIETANVSVTGNIINNVGSVPAFEMGGEFVSGYVSIENNQVYGARDGVGEQCGDVELNSDFISIRNNLFQGITDIDINTTVTENFNRVVISGNYGFQNQTGTTMVSPDGTEYFCNVANGGAFSCS